MRISDWSSDVCSSDLKLPIVVRAPALGAVRLQFSLLEGFRVLAPFWIFENLVIEGTCETDHRCEHAFHIVGDAAGTVIQNNWVTDFNAAVKVNGKDGRYHDEGNRSEESRVGKECVSTGRSRGSP